MPPKKRVKKVENDCVSDSENAENIAPKLKQTVSKTIDSKESIRCIDLISSDTENDENVAPVAKAESTSVNTRLARACKRTVSVRKSLELKSKDILNQEVDTKVATLKSKKATSHKSASNILASSSLVNQPLLSSSNNQPNSNQKTNAQATYSKKENDEEPMGK
jgi:hypothetical protein